MDFTSDRERAAEQIDWIRFEDEGAQYDHLLLASVERVGIDVVARHLGITPSALRNQIAGRRKMQAGTSSICWRLDPEFRAALADMKGEVIARPPDLTPEEALREAMVHAQARGYIDCRDLARLYARTKKGES